MTAVAVTPPRFEVVATHPETCRCNLLAWSLTELEARRILRELQDAQRARQGGIVVGGHVEAGWTYSVREQGAATTAPTPVDDGTIAQKWNGVDPYGSAPAPTKPARPRRRTLKGMP